VSFSKSTIWRLPPVWSSASGRRTTTLWLLFVWQERRTNSWPIGPFDGQWRRPPLDAHLADGELLTQTLWR
jgi:hypothetical protein